MTNRFLRLGRVAALLAALSVGCNDGGSSIDSAQRPSTVPATDIGDHHAHDGDEHYHEAHESTPQSYQDAMTQLVALRDQIRDGFASKKIDEAHGALHAVGHVLEALPALVAQQSPPIDAKAIQKVTKELFDLFTKVDDKMHGAEGADYSEVAGSIDASVERLQKLLPADGSAAAAEPSSGEE